MRRVRELGPRLANPDPSPSPSPNPRQVSGDALPWPLCTRAASALPHARPLTLAVARTPTPTPGPTL